MISHGLVMLFFYSPHDFLVPLVGLVHDFLVPFLGLVHDFLVPLPGLVHDFLVPLVGMVHDFLMPLPGLVHGFFMSILFLIPVFLGRDGAVLVRLNHFLDAPPYHRDLTDADKQSDKWHDDVCQGLEL